MNKPQFREEMRIANAISNAAPAKPRWAIDGAITLKIERTLYYKREYNWAKAQYRNTRSKHDGQD